MKNRIICLLVSALFIGIAVLGPIGCTKTVTSSVTSTVTNTATQNVTQTNTATQSVTTTQNVTTTQTATQSITTTKNITTTAYPLDPIVVDMAAKEVSFGATMKKSEHSNQDPTKLAGGPTALMTEWVGSALTVAALQADPGVNAEKLAYALMALGLTPGNNVHVGDTGKTAAGSPLKVYIEVNGKRTLLDDILKSSMPDVKVNFVFLGTVKDQQQIGCGCLLCGRSGPGSVVADAAYTNSELCPGGSTMYDGLTKLGLKIGDKVKIVIKV